MDPRASPRVCLEQQLDELELLQSVFFQPGEFTADDQAVLDHATACVKRLTSEPPRGRLACSLHLAVERVRHEGVPDGDDEEEGTGVCAATCSDTVSGDHATPQCSVDISMRLPHSYPAQPPDVYVSSNSLTRRGQDDLNSDLTTVITDMPRGEVCLLSIAEWVRDNVGSYCPLPTLQSDELDTSTGSVTFCRTWLYMHHIYSKTKRRNILDLADDLELTGFCLPGKPGVVCVEGDERRTKHFYGILRRWNWKSITCRKKELVPECGDLASCRRMSGFRELALVTHGPRQNHMDMGQFRDYLEQHRLGHMFTELFGVEGQSVEKST